MRFSVDAHAIGRHLTGNEVYVRNLLNGFAALDQEADFIAYLSHDVNGAASAVPQRFVKRHVSANPLVRLGADLSRKLREDKPDLIHVQYTAPLACPVPVVVSVHDVSFLEHPEYFTWPRAMQLKFTVKRTIRNAARVITPSEFSRHEIIRNCNLNESRIDVVPIAMSPIFRPLAREGAHAFLTERFHLDGPFVLTVGDLQPRKNQIGLIRAFEALLIANPQLKQKLVIVGQRTWFSDRIMDEVKRSRVADRILFTGFVNDDELLQLYNASDLMVFPSFYEGFGLPVLEAMACGRAVACSNTSAMPEVANAAAILFNPSSPEEISRAMRDILLDADLRSRMERLGLQRASLFTWERTARRTLEIYYQVAEAAGAQSVVSSSTVPAART